MCGHLRRPNSRSVAFLRRPSTTRPRRLAHIAEFDERKLYLPAAYPSMFAYCVGELGLSEEEAKKRIRVARIARTCPQALDALAEGRVHLSGLVVLAARLTPASAPLEERVKRALSWFGARIARTVKPVDRAASEASFPAPAPARQTYAAVSCET